MRAGGLWGYLVEQGRVWCRGCWRVVAGLRSHTRWATWPFRGHEKRRAEADEQPVSQMTTPPAYRMPYLKDLRVRKPSQLPILFKLLRGNSSQLALPGYRVASTAQSIGNRATGVVVILASQLSRRNSSRPALLKLPHRNSSHPH